MRAIAVNGDVLTTKRLADEVGHHAAVVRVHERTVGVEDAHHANVEIVRAVVVEHDGLGGTLALVVAGAGSDGIHVAVVLLCASLSSDDPTCLGMNQRISVDLAGARVEETAARVTRQAKEVQNAEDRALERLDRIGLLSRGAQRRTW